MADTSPTHHPPEEDIPLSDNLNEADTIGNLPKDLSGFISARVELASIEAREAAEFATSKAVHGVILGVCAFLAWSLFLGGLTGLVAPIANRWLVGKIDGLPGWAAVLFVLAILHGIGALIFLGRLKKKPSAPLFELSRKEIEHDKQWLTNNK